MIRRNEGLSHANAKGEAAFPPRGKNNRYRTRRSSSASDLTKCSRSRKARAWLFSQFVFSSDGCAIVADISIPMQRAATRGSISEDQNHVFALP